MASRFVLPHSWDLMHLRVCVGKCSLSSESGKSLWAHSSPAPTRCVSVCGSQIDLQQRWKDKGKPVASFFTSETAAVSVRGYDNLMRRSFLAVRRALATRSDDFIKLTDLHSLAFFWNGWWWFNRGFFWVAFHKLHLHHLQRLWFNTRLHLSAH